MADISPDTLKNGVYTIENPKESVKKYYTDTKDRTVIEEMTLELKPLEGSFRNALMRRGYAADKMTFETVLVAFYNEFYAAPGDKKPLNFLSENPLSGVTVSEFENTDHIAPQMAQAAISAIGGIVKGAKGIAQNVTDRSKLKKAIALINAGQSNQLTAHQRNLVNAADPSLLAAPLTKEEQLLAKDVDKTLTSLEQKEQNEVSVTEGKMKKIIIGVLIAVVLLIALKYFKII